MPIMAPLADLTGVTRQTAVLAYQFGDGFTNMLVPTNALLMGMLSLGRIPYERWVRFVVPLLVKAVPRRRSRVGGGGPARVLRVAARVARAGDPSRARLGARRSSAAIQ